MNILYLGTKGAGPGLTYAFAKELQSYSRLDKIIISDKNELIGKFRETFRENLIEFEIPNSLFGALNVLRFIRFIRTLNMKCLGNQEYFVPMHHPWSILYCLLVKKRKYSIIHDFVPHEGDNKLLLKIANYSICKSSDLTLFLTNTQRREAIKSGYITSEYCKTISHPSFHHYKKEVTYIDNKKHDFLFFGRLEPYKGLDRLIKSFLALKAVHPSITLHVCGRPGVGFDPNIINQDGIIASTRYIPDDEVPLIFSSAKVVTLPYDEATQSGVMVLANDFGCCTAITPTLGLLDQSKQLPNIFVAKSFNIEDYSEAMYSALNAHGNVSGKPIVSGLVELL